MRSSKISYINKKFDLESEELLAKRICIKQPETVSDMSTELIALNESIINDLKNSINDQNLGEIKGLNKILSRQILIKIKNYTEKKIYGSFDNSLCQHQRLRLQFISQLEQYIDDLVADADLPFFNFIRSNPSRMGYQQIFSIINYYYRCENFETKLNQQSIQDFQDFDEKQSISNKSNLSNYFDL